MKIKLIILTAIAAAVVYSCTSDRDESIVPVSEKTSKSENLKLNTLSVETSNESSLKIDTINLKSGNGTTGGEGIKPGDGETIDPTKPDKPW